MPPDFMLSSVLMHTEAAHDDEALSLGNDRDDSMSVALRIRLLNLLTEVTLALSFTCF